MQRAQRLHRVQLLCTHFARNLAYYRARQSDGGDLTPNTQFWRTKHSNSVDIAVLEWCKLFADGREKYAWTKVVSNRTDFESALLKTVKMSDKEFAKYTNSFKYFRDKFVAHLDDENLMPIPQFDAAWAAVQFYFDHVTNTELRDVALLGFNQISIQEYYQRHFDEARTIYVSLSKNA